VLEAERVQRPGQMTGYEASPAPPPPHPMRGAQIAPQAGSSQGWPRDAERTPVGCLAQLSACALFLRAYGERGLRCGHGAAKQSAPPTRRRV
jgi:hypothetical protein